MPFRENWLDARLGAIASRIGGDAALVADVGADHGRLACALLTSRPMLRMIVADISADSLAKARRLLESRGQLGRCLLRVADGLRAIEPCDCPDAIVMAGMGGETMRNILSAEGAVRAIGGAKLILQPNADAPLLRDWLCTAGFPLCEETVTRSGGRFYVILCARRGTAVALTPKQSALGPHLLTQKPPDYADYLRWHRRVLSRTLSGLRAARSRDPAREDALAREIAWIEEEIPCE